MEESVMTDKNPNFLSRELVQVFFHREVTDDEFAAAKRTAEWGADQELDACCEWLRDNGFDAAAIRLYMDRRPALKKKKAQKALNRIETLVREELDEHWRLELWSLFVTVFESLEELPND